MRIGLAFSCFFSLLFRGRLPERALALAALEFPGPPPPGPPVIPASAPAPPVAAPVPAPGADTDARSEGALALLGLLQREARLVDFLRESLDGYPDAQVGAAVREVHRACAQALDRYLDIEPVLPGNENTPVVVPDGFDPTEVRLVGDAAGAPPFRGTLLHHGWRARAVRFPQFSSGVDRRVLAPAEVRVA